MDEGALKEHLRGKPHKRRYVTMQGPLIVQDIKYDHIERL